MKKKRFTFLTLSTLTWTDNDGAIETISKSKLFPAFFFLYCLLSDFAVGEPFQWEHWKEKKHSRFGCWKCQRIWIFEGSLKNLSESQKFDAKTFQVAKKALKDIHFSYFGWFNFTCKIHVCFGFLFRCVESRRLDYDRGCLSDVSLFHHHNEMVFGIFRCECVILCTFFLLIVGIIIVGVVADGDVSRTMWRVHATCIPHQ